MSQSLIQETLDRVAKHKVMEPLFRIGQSHGTRSGQAISDSSAREQCIRIWCTPGVCTDLKKKYQLVCWQSPVLCREF